MGRGAFSEEAERRIEEGREAAEALNQALRDIGLPPLPNLQGTFPFRRAAMVDLGVAPADLVVRLAERIRELSAGGSRKQDDAHGIPGGERRPAPGDQAREAGQARRGT